jgi:hypothetical protein
MSAKINPIGDVFNTSTEHTYANITDAATEDASGSDAEGTVDEENLYDYKKTCQEHTSQKVGELLNFSFQSLSTSLEAARGALSFVLASQNEGNVGQTPEFPTSLVEIFSEEPQGEDAREFNNLMDWNVDDVPVIEGDEPTEKTVVRETPNAIDETFAAVVNFIQRAEGIDLSDSAQIREGMPNLDQHRITGEKLIAEHIN